MQELMIEEILLYLDKMNIEYEYKGKKNIKLIGYSALNQYKKGTFTWIKSIDNWEEELDITLAFVQRGVEVPIENQIVTEISKKAFFSVIEEFYEEDEERTIGCNTVIGRDVVIGDNVCIGNNCSISGNVVIGDDTTISDNVVIKNNVIIGSGCYIQAFVVIGEDGFGLYENSDNTKIMIKHHGGVKIGNNVFIGSHVNIARGTLADTIISDGVKIAPSSHIGHNNQIGKNAIVICSQLYGSVELGENAYVVGSIVRNQTCVGNDSFIGMGSVVTKSVPENCVAYGAPAKIVREN